MTREEAVRIAQNTGSSISGGDKFIKILEALGLIKFNEPKKETNVLVEFNEKCVSLPRGNAPEFVIKYGVIRLEEWPEGLVLWVGGRMVWQSWIGK